MLEENLKKRSAFIKTLSFFDIFDFALTCDEVIDYMFYKKWSFDELYDFINHSEFVIENNCNVYFKGRALTQNVRRDKEHRAKKLIKKAQKFIKYMQFLPFIRMVGICNSLAFFDAEKGSDIDIFIITEKKRLFIARIFALFFTQMLGIRRHGKKIKGRFCLSFMISTEGMNFEKLKLNDDDIYFFYWIRLLQPVIGMQTYLEFIKSNQWIRQYFDYEINQNKLLIPVSRTQLFFQNLLEFPLKGFLGNFIEKQLSKWQKNRAEKKSKKLPNNLGIVISDTMLKFHDSDMRKKYSSLWKKRISQFERYLIPTSHDFEKQALSQSQQTNMPYESHFQDIFDKKSEEPRHR